MTTNRNSFEDILSDRRQEISNYCWINRGISTTKAVKIKPRPSPQSHKLAVLNSPKIRELITQISKRENVTDEEVEKRIKLILEEIGYTKNLNIIRWIGYTLVKICKNVCSGIYVNYEGILEVKAKMGRCPVVFVPSHRSYADFIIFSYVCFHYDIEIPAIAAGMDFHGMMGMGEVLRNTGAFFMRRSYNDDSLYWTTFKEYVNQIVAKGDLPIEFFIEGTRSRSNKSISPKYGLFNMILKAFFLAQVPDILFVPVSVNYDRILEESLFAFELLGIPKPKESTSGFFKSLKIVKEKFGNIYFHFGQPISARDFFADQLYKSKHNFAPLHLHEITEYEKQVIPPLAYEIIRNQQANNRLSGFNVIASIVNGNLTAGRKFVELNELKKELGVLKATLKRWGANVFEQTTEEAITEALIVHENLLSCDDGGQVALVTNKVEIGQLDPKKLKAHALNEDTIRYSVPFVMLQIYANPVLHYLVDAAFVVMVLRSRGKVGVDELFGHFCTLRSIFSFEFVLLESWYKMQFEKALDNLRKEHIIVMRNEEYDIFENNYLEEVLIDSVQPFVLIYYVVAVILEKDPVSVEEKTVLANVQELLEGIIGQKNIFIHPYCMTLDSLTNCLNSFSKMGVLKKSRRNGKNVYEVNQEEVAKVKNALESFVPSFQSVKIFEIFMHIKSKM